MRTMALLVFSLASPCVAQASSQTSQADATKTLERAILVAGPSVAELPIEIAAIPPGAASRGAEAWMLRGQDGQAERIVVYSESDVFHCSLRQMDCLLKLASTIIHEAWHYKHGPSEAGAYDAQITFLIMRGGSIAQIDGVKLARDRILAARHAAEQRRQLTRPDGQPFKGKGRSED